MKSRELDVKPYNPLTDTIEIEGTTYSANFFRELGCSFRNMVGQVLRIDCKENKRVTVTRMRKFEKIKGDKNGRRKRNDQKQAFEGY